MFKCDFALTYFELNAIMKSTIAAAEKTHVKLEEVHAGYGIFEFTAVATDAQLTEFTRIIFGDDPDDEATTYVKENAVNI